jgi:hypothetical protein
MDQKGNEEGTDAECHKKNCWDLQELLYRLMNLLRELHEKRVRAYVFTELSLRFYNLQFRLGGAHVKPARVEQISPEKQ